VALASFDLGPEWSPGWSGVKTCIKCRSDLPDSAVHCVFCGAKQPQAAAGRPANPAELRTMMGFPGSTAEELRQAAESRQRGLTPPPVYTDDEPEEEAPTVLRPVGPHGGPGSGPHQPPQAHEKRTMAIAPGSSPVGTPPPAQPTGSPMVAGAGAPKVGGSDALAATLPGEGHSYGKPPTMNAPPVANPMQGAPVGGGMHGGHPGLGYMPGIPSVPPGDARALAPGMAPAYAEAARPPYLASETHGRAFAPREPWADTLPTLLLVFGVLFAACFVAPWGVVGNGTVFSWSVLQSPGLLAKLPPLLLGGSSILAIVFAFTPLSVAGRGWASGLLGLACLQTLPIIALVQSLEGGVSFPLLGQAILALVATFTLLPGLLLRSQYRASLLPRILTTVGVVCALAPVLIPSGGSLPIVGMAQAAFASPLQPSLLVSMGFLLVVLAGLLVWLPASTGAGAVVLAWLLIVRIVAEPWVASFANGIDPSAIKGQLSVLFYVPLTAMGWTVLCSYGLASALGKKLEQ